MTLESILLFALALLAAGNVGLALLTYFLRQQAKSTAGQCARFESRFVTVGIKLGELQKASPVNLAAEVAALSEAVARLRATHQRFQGRFDQYMGQEREQRADDEPADEKWQALMQLQRQSNGRP